MCVTVPVAPISRSPLASETPMASPSRSGPGGGTSAGFAVMPVTIGVKPGAAKAGRHQVDGFGLEAADQQRRRDWPQHRADLRACRGGKTNRLHVGRTPRKRREARREGRQRGGESLARDRQFETRLVRPAAAGAAGRVLHLRDRRDARDRLLRKLSNRVRDRADQASVDVDRASAHALGDARLREPGALEPREDQIAAAGPVRFAGRR